MILVDAAIWPWRGRRWAHLVSDRDLGELHRFAARLGLPRVGFQGDHYDVDEATRARALVDGALPVSSRELLGRLRSAGLRRPAGAGPWRWQVVAEWSLAEWSGPPAPTLPAEVAVLAAALERLTDRWAHPDAPASTVLRLMRRPGERAAIVVDLAVGPGPPLAELVVEVSEGAAGPDDARPHGPRPQ